MRKIHFLIFILLFTTSWALPVSAGVPTAGDLSGEAVVLMDAATGQVLYEKDPDSRRHPASITKIMTALLVLEHLNPSDTVIASASAVDLPSWSSSAYLQEGERLTVEQAMYAMMLRSGNDAANVLAEATADSVGSFAALMNQRARELGAKNTSYSNPHGLPQSNHLTTAYDMALITQAAVQTPGFPAYFGAASYQMPATNKNEARTFTNTHRMLLSSYAQYDETVTGGKTGYTMPSGYTLVTVAQRDGRTLICVVLNSQTCYADTQTLLDFGFNEFTPALYPLESADAPLSVPLWDGEREAGLAYLSLPEAALLLLHESIAEEELSVNYQYPARADADEELGGYAEINLPGGAQNGLPGTLLSVPLEVDIVRFDPPAIEVMAPATHTKAPANVHQAACGFTRTLPPIVLAGAILVAAIIAAGWVKRR